MRRRPSRPERALVKFEDAEKVMTSLSSSEKTACPAPCSHAPQRPSFGY
jgi:hypothetical protein